MSDLHTYTMNLDGDKANDVLDACQEAAIDQLLLNNGCVPQMKIRKKIVRESASQTVGRSIFRHASTKHKRIGIADPVCLPEHGHNGGYGVRK